MELNKFQLIGTSFLEILKIEVSELKIQGLSDILIYRNFFKNIFCRRKAWYRDYHKPPIKILDFWYMKNLFG